MKYKFTSFARLGHLLALALLLSGSNLCAQQATGTDPAFVRSEIQKSAPAVQVTMRDCKEDYDPLLKTVKKEMPKPGTNLKKEEFRRLKAEANANRNQNIVPSQKTTAGPAPTLGANYIGNFYNGADPADNALAVGRDGTVLSATNTRIHIFDSTGNQLSTSTLVGFAQGLSGIPSFMFDPKVTYDPDSDRWIVVYLAGANSSNSNIVVGFSQTDDPTGTYNLYALDGNPFNNNLWTDFPQIGISTDELFITGNLFTDGFQNQGSAIWQINKADGYAGNNLTFVTYETDQYFSLHPVEGGGELYGPNFYFVRVFPGGTGIGNEVHLHEITNTIANNGTLNAPNTYTLNLDYRVPPDAIQGNLNDILQSNDNRVQSSYFRNNRIEFVFNTGGAGAGVNVYHGTGVLSPITPAFNNFTGKIINFTGYEIAYPSIAYAGSQASDGTNRSYVGFNFAGVGRFPGHGACISDENGHSDILETQPGVNIINSGDDRWGDYTDIAERPGKPGEAWAAGTYGNITADQRCYIAQILPAQPVSVERPIADGELQAFPNPAVDRITFTFPVTDQDTYDLVIRDLNGRELRRFVEYTLSPGEAKLAFNTSHLAAGMYIVSVQNTDRVLFTRKFSVK